MGSYYLLVNNMDLARRYLQKATTLDRVMGPAWLLYGHSFSLESEHDQAMAAYFKASHLMRGCHLPLLYIGVEYGLTDNAKLAEKFFNQALSIAPDDPFVLHEMGVTAFQSDEWDTAERHFRRALDILRRKGDVVNLPEKWEPVLNNLAHVLRKKGLYKEALELHHEALLLCPQNASTYSAIGFVLCLQGKWSEAVQYLHKALGLKRDDAFSSSMLNHAMDHLVSGLPGSALPPDCDTSSLNLSKLMTPPASHASALMAIDDSDSFILGRGSLPGAEKTSSDIEMDITT